MSSQPSVVTTTVDLGREELQHGYIRVPYSHDRSAYGHIPIPVSVARRGEGPTVLLTGGVHGDEYECPVALMRPIREFSVERLTGRIVMIPALNFPACLSGRRTFLIDHLALNWRLPGDRNGMPTDTIAHDLKTVLLPMADYCFDFHAGGASLRYLPSLIAERPKADRQRCQLEALSGGFHPPRVLFMDMLSGDRFIAAAAARNICFLAGEFGGGGNLDLDGLELLADGLPGVLSALGVFDRGQPTRRSAWGEMSRRPSVKGLDHYIFAPRPGIFEPCFRLGETVEHGRIAGTIHNPHMPWRASAEIRFAGSGIALCIRTPALVAAGDCLGHFASDGP
jgi:predicted deacylase